MIPVSTDPYLFYYYIAPRHRPRDFPTTLNCQTISMNNVRNNGIFMCFPRMRLIEEEVGIW